MASALKADHWCLFHYFTLGSDTFSAGSVTMQTPLVISLFVVSMGEQTFTRKSSRRYDFVEADIKIYTTMSAMIPLTQRIKNQFVYTKMSLKSELWSLDTINVTCQNSVVSCLHY